jgi:GDP-mannose 6-dehydrogenase
MVINKNEFVCREKNKILLNMNISIFGLGYVGCVSLGCLASLKHKVIGVDKNKIKVDLINSGKAPITEPGLLKLVKKGFKDKLITATLDYKTAIKDSELSFVCIGTPGSSNGNLNLRFLLNAVKQIASGIKEKKEFHTVVIRSTIMPGTHKFIVDTIEKHTGKLHLKDFCVVINPEFLREGSAVQDFLNPPVTVIGSKCKRGITILRKIYKDIQTEIKIVEENAAEIIKLASNSFHSMKISFANEIGTLCKRAGVDSNLLMEIFCSDKKLNISTAYLKPGFAFGGSCLPKDIKALAKIAGSNEVDIPLIKSAGMSNDLHIKRTFELIKSVGKKKIGIWGLSFKNGTDDMRGSPIIKIINLLLDLKYEIKAFDRNINIEMLIGSNKEYVKKYFKRIDNVFEKDFRKFLDFSDFIVINSYNRKLINEIKKYKNKIILDLVHIPELKNMKNYRGICW